jgi:hypothetical protein
MTVTITRQPSTSLGTFGVLARDGIPLCVTAERPWKNNQHKVSCIPPGTYRCTRFKSPRNGDCWLLHGVPDRDMIELHAANRPSQLSGCLAPGRSFSMFEDEPGVTSSKLTMELLFSELPRDFDLTIIQPT